MLNLFQKIPGLGEGNLHPKFKQLSGVMMDGERKIISSWTNGFVDRDNKLVKEFQTTFHSSFWELYLHHLFKELDFEIDYSKNRPDFILTVPHEMYVEAVISGIKENGRNESTRGINDILSMLDPPHLQEDFFENIDEAITRYSNALSFKNMKFTNRYSKLPYLKGDVPFLLALSSFSQVNYGREFYYPLLALLYGLYYDPISREYYLLDSITKPGTNSQIKIGLFTDKSMEGISAVVFSCTLTLGKLTSLSKSANNSELNQNEVIIIRENFEPPFYQFQHVSNASPEEHSDGLFIFHNPHARNKLSNEVFSKTRALQISMIDDQIQFEGRVSPIFSRINLPKMILTDDIRNKLIEETFDRFNS